MGIQGSYLNHLDLFQHLKSKGHKVRFYCENVKNLFEIVKNTRRSYTFDKGEIKLVRDEIVEPGVIITDFKTLIMMRELKCMIICKKLIVMDSIELTYHLKEMRDARFYYDVDAHDLIKQFFTDEVVFLMPPNNYKLFIQKYPKLQAEVFFKHINSEMLDTIEHEDREGYFFRWDDVDGYVEEVTDKFGGNGFLYEPEWNFKRGRKIPFRYNEIDHIFDYQSLVYRRRKYLAYQEQFGRLIFEYILMGKTVYFANEPYTDDGLTDYLHHFDIQFDGNKVITTKDELREKMKSYDKEPWRIL